MISSRNGMQECRRIINQKHDNTVFKAASSLVHNELLNEIYVNGTSGRKQYHLGCPLEKKTPIIVFKETTTTYLSMDRLWTVEFGKNIHSLFWPCLCWEERSRETENDRLTFYQINQVSNASRATGGRRFMQSVQAFWGLWPLTVLPTFIAKPFFLHNTLLRFFWECSIL